MLDSNQNFEHNALEVDIEKLGREVSEKRNLPEYKDISEKELIRQFLKPMINQVSNQSGQSVVQKSSQDSGVLPSYLKDAPAEVKLKIEKLIDAVFHQGLKKAVSEAKKSGFFIEDAFHDALTDKFYEEMRGRGMLK
ncbi:MAG: hypothetical protein AAB772_00655 [Patescibacteria group bacterium]